MTVEEIKRAVDQGHPVKWSGYSYDVIKDKTGQYLIKCSDNGHCIGLTHQDGKTLNGLESDFYIHKTSQA